MSVLTTVGCRFRQVFFRAGYRMRPVREPEVEDGRGAIYSTAQLIRSNRLSRPLLVVGPDAGAWDERLRQALEESDLTLFVWDEVSELPTADDGERLRLFWDGKSCDCFLALGGPKTIDLVKAAAARAACRTRTIMGMVGHGRVGRKTPPVIAIPTVTGSGAESLAWATVSDDAGNRFRLEDSALTPAFAVLDPSLLADVSRDALAQSVMDGMCLAVEAYLSRYADETARTAAANAVKAFFDVAEPCWNSGGTLIQRGRLLEASRLAGRAASAAGGGYARALSEAMSVLDIPFGEACAVILPAVLVKYGNYAVSDLARLSEDAGVCAEGTKAEKAAALIRRIRGMAFRLGLPDTLEPLDADAAAEAADVAAATANPRWASPVVWTSEDLGRVIRTACTNG